MGENSGDDKSAVNTQQQTKVKLPRLYHKKSRTGCQRCRARRVKCDETRPICGSCNRHEVPCVYVNPAPLQKPAAQKSSPSTPSDTDTQAPLEINFPLLQLDEIALQQALYVSAAATPDEFHDGTIFDITESRARRMLELRLLGNFIENTSQTFSACNYADVRHAWSVEVPRISLEHENLLYEMFAISALHLLRSEPHNPDLIVARQAYLGLSLRAHRQAISHLHPLNADAVCFTSSLILIDSFASIQDRLLEPYMPPMEWLQMARGAGSVFSIALDAIHTPEASSILPIARAKPDLTDRDTLFSPRNRDRLMDILTHERHTELWDLETQQAYEQTLSYIGGIQIAMENGMHILGIARLLMAFALLVPRKFVEMVGEYRPRALVTLAHFFALSSQLGDIWWIGNVARREVDAIAGVLPPQWLPALVGPLSAVSFGQI